MRRFHLFEIEDQSWCPAVIRDGITDYLQFTINAARPYAPIAGRLAEVIRGSGTSAVVDLCSGAGGPWPTLVDAVADVTPVHVALTDLHPNVEALERVRTLAPDAIGYRAERVDATRVPRDLSGARTLFTSFHHFAPDSARQVLRDAADAGVPIAVFEATNRGIAAILVTLLSPIVVLFATPAIRPFRWSRLFWTYLIPVIPLAVLFDGIVSCLRTYTPAELLEMSRGIGDGDGYRWVAGEERAKGPVPLTYLTGTPMNHRSSP